MHVVFQAAMRSAEDEVDATAAAAVEQEAAAELAEFTVDPPLVPADQEIEGEGDEGQDVEIGEEKAEDDEQFGDDEGEKEEEGSKPGGTPEEVDAGVKEEGEGTDGADGCEEDDGDELLARGIVGSEELQRIEETFLPVEKYAVRFVEEVCSRAV